jgi:hypothetical protein
LGHEFLLTFIEEYPECIKRTVPVSMGVPEREKTDPCECLTNTARRVVRFRVYTHEDGSLSIYDFCNAACQTFEGFCIIPINHRPPASIHYAPIKSGYSVFQQGECCSNRAPVLNQETNRFPSCLSFYLPPSEGLS